VHAIDQIGPTILLQGITEQQQITQNDRNTYTCRPR